MFSGASVAPNSTRIIAFRDPGPVPALNATGTAAHCDSPASRATRTGSPGRNSLISLRCPAEAATSVPVSQYPQQQKQLLPSWLVIMIGDVPSCSQQPGCGLSQ